MVMTRSAALVAARHPEYELYFRRGMGSVFRMWTALELAIFHQWGGSSGQQVVAELEEELMDLFRGAEKMYKDDVSLILEDYMETHFNTLLEDDSPDEIGEILCTMFNNIVKGDFEMVNGICAKEAARTASLAGQGVAQRSQGMGGNGDEDSDDDIEENEESKARMQAALAEASVGGGLAGVKEEGDEDVDMEEEEEAPPLVDEDGFETVISGKKKKGGRR